MKGIETIGACDTRSYVETKMRSTCFDPAIAETVELADVPFHAPNVADQPVELLFCRAPPRLVLSPDKSTRRLYTNRLTTLPDGVFDRLGSLNTL